MFLKTHKTGGSTVQNLVLRYVDKKNLTLATPPWDKVTFNDRTRFAAEYVRNFKNRKSYDVITHHLRFDSTQNPSWFDFGYDCRAEDSEELYVRALVEIETSFNLILISEYFDEGMILLKEALCWDIDDVVTFKHNSRSEKDIKTVSKDMAVKIQEWNSLDSRLYQHFNVTFWAKVQEMMGLARLQHEVAVLREKRSMLEKQCSPDGLVEVDSGKYFKEGVHLMGHSLRSDLDNEQKKKCELYFIHPKVYTEILYAKQHHY
ncbi:hypothetical protein AAFF_G00162840 [Aldrovandia affinis]|uniref:Uncharacterized protein n=1 Tax=Aldrovandia affinis TaxID=143900 RepID=A0AAD7WVU8_9TELE|nr:hypothetical protein AAFF_G00162840 [Aldrovandia affinis]